MKYYVDLNKIGTEFPHYWEQSVGCCHATTVLREDVRKHIRKAHEECGFKYLRFHGLFDDDMSVIIKNILTGEVEYSFFNIDSIFDFLLETGMKPFIELGFMPEALASGKKTCFHYKANVTPPDSYDKWGELITLFVTHLIERYGIGEVKTWFFEVWNEPNLRFFFDGTKAEYFRLYQVTANAVKGVNTDLRVGGPATSANSWIKDIIAFCEETKTPIDFISTHHYPNDDPLSAIGGTNDEESKFMDMEQLLLVDKEKAMEYFSSLQKKAYPRDVLTTMAETAKKECNGLPLYYTEWNGAKEFDTSYQAAFVIKTLADNSGLVDGYSFWTVSDIFEEMGMSSVPFKNAFGMLNIHGIEKPVYHIFKEIHEAGEERVEVIGEHATVEILALRKNNITTLFVYNHNTPGGDIKAEKVDIRIGGNIQSIEYAVIDEENTNPLKAWIEMGRPAYPDKARLEKLKEEARLVYKGLDIKIEKNCEFSISAQAESVTIIKVTEKQ